MQHTQKSRPSLKLSTAGLAPTEDVAHLASQQLLSEEAQAAARAAAKKAKKDKQKSRKQQQQLQASQSTDPHLVHPTSVPLRCP